MDTKLIDWSKTILFTQAIMPRILNAITKENEKMLHQGFGSQHFDVGQNTYDFLEHMLKVNIRKRNLLELYNNVNATLKEMDAVEKRILIDRFFKKKSVGELLPHLNIRTAYRHYNNALSSFARSMQSLGYTVDKMEELFGDDKVIMAMHHRVVSHAIVFRAENEKLVDIPRIDAKVDVVPSNMPRLSVMQSVNRVSV